MSLKVKLSVQERLLNALTYVSRKAVKYGDGDDEYLRRVNAILEEVRAEARAPVEHERDEARAQVEALREELEHVQFVHRRELGTLEDAERSYVPPESPAVITREEAARLVCESMGCRLRDGNKEHWSVCLDVRRALVVEP